MSAWDDMHAEAIENLERPDGCECDIEFIYGGAPSKILRADIRHDLDCPGGMPRTAEALERLSRSKSEPDEVTDEERHFMAGAAKASRHAIAIVRMAARRAGVA